MAGIDAGSIVAVLYTKPDPRGKSRPSILSLLVAIPRRAMARGQRPGWDRGGRSHASVLRSAAIVGCLLALWLALAGAAGARTTEAPLASKLARALHQKGLADGRTAAVAVELESGSIVYQLNAATALVPASTEKLGVALTVLDELGPSFRIETLVLGDGEQMNSVWRGDLVLEGFGDPSLTAADLVTLAKRIRAAGIRKITGRILGDDSYFDSRRSAPGWKPSFYKIESPPLSALVVDRASLDGKTGDEPALAAAIAFKRALRRTGISVAGQSELGRAEAPSTELARVVSPPLSRLVAWMDAESDNFFAEMLLKVLGAHELGRGTSAAGASVVRRELVSRGIPLEGVRLVDGSGLSSADRVTARALVALLISAQHDPRISGPFIGSLAVAGVSGTLEDRMQKGPAHGDVRAKTGTTDLASALAGYAGDRYAFVLLMNGSPVDLTAARRAQDRFATILAAAS